MNDDKTAQPNTNSVCYKNEPDTYFRTKFLLESCWTSFNIDVVNRRSNIPVCGDRESSPFVIFLFTNDESFGDAAFQPSEYPNHHCVFAVVCYRIQTLMRLMDLGGGILFIRFQIYSILVNETQNFRWTQIHNSLLSFEQWRRFEDESYETHLHYS